MKTEIKFTLKDLEKLNPCIEGLKWYKENIKTENLEEILTILSNKRFSWCSWLFTKLLTRKQNQLLAVYCAELVLPIYEEKHPNDKRVRECIKATKDFLNDKVSRGYLIEKRNAAVAVAAAAADAYTAAYAVAYAAVDAAYAAAYADAYTAVSAASVGNIIKLKIIKEVMRLLNDNRNSTPR